MNHLDGHELGSGGSAVFDGGQRGYRWESASQHTAKLGYGLDFKASGNIRATSPPLACIGKPRLTRAVSERFPSSALVWGGESHRPSLRGARLITRRS